MTTDVLAFNLDGGAITLTFDKDTNTILVKNSSEFPLTINFDGGINFNLTSDLIIETKGEFNLTTLNKPVTIDSYENNIWLNSGKSKKLRKTDNIQLEDLRAASKAAIENSRNRDNHALTKLQVLENIINNMNKRIGELESKLS